jgi:putative transposase
MITSAHGTRAGSGSGSTKAGANALGPNAAETRLHRLFPTIVLVWADTHYQGLRLWAKQTLGWTLEVVKPWWINFSRRRLLYGDGMPRIPTGFHVLPRRWGIERTFAGLGTNRRLAIDCEKLPETGETFIYRAMSRILMKRLARSIHT